MADSCQLHRSMVRAERLDQAHRTEDAVALLQSVLKTQGRGEPSPLVIQAVLRLAELENARWTPGVEIRRLLARWGIEETPQGQVELAWADYRETGTTDPSRLAALVQNDALRGTRAYLRVHLVAGKILAEQGALESARGWLLRGMRAARAQLNETLLAAFAGALAEVFYLGGQMRDALELFELDGHMLTPGSRDVERLAIYRGHCYRQLGQVEAGRTLYQDAQMRSELRGDASAYAIRGRLWCAVLDDDTHTAERLGDALEKGDDEHSYALGLFGLAALQSGEKRTALLVRAAELLERDHYEREAAWARGNAWAPPRYGESALHTPITREEIDACDNGWMHVPLASLAATHAESLNAFQSENACGRVALRWMRAFF